MTKLEQAQALLAVSEAIRDAALGNLDRIPEAWGTRELQALVRAIALSQTDKLKGPSQLAFERAFLDQKLDQLRDEPSASVPMTESLKIDGIVFDALG